MAEVAQVHVEDARGVELRVAVGIGMLALAGRVVGIPGQTQRLLAHILQHSPGFGAGCDVAPFEILHGQAHVVCPCAPRRLAQ